MSATGRDRIFALSLQIARSRRDRGHLEEITPETVISAARDEEIDVSGRTVRRVLDAMSELDVLERTSDEPIRYRLVDELSSSASSNYRRETADLGSDDVGISDDDVLIYHLYADVGVESEPLSAYGRVVRVGLDPRETRFGDVIRADARQPPLSDEADLVVLHPPCQRWSTLTTINGDPDDHPDLIPDARRIGRELGDDYIIENVPEAPLEDPVTLNGRMFGLPVHYRRAFETSFTVDQPDETADLVDPSGPFAADGSIGDWRGSAILWRTAKQVTGEYPAEDLKRSGIPAPYIHYLARYWLRSRPDLAGTAHETAVATDGGGSL